MSTADEVVAAARGLLGVPFRHQGRSPEGIDCVGLVTCIAKALGISSYDAVGYRRFPRAIDSTPIEAVCGREMMQIDPAEMRAGDVALFAYEHTRHLAVVADYHAGGLSIVHAYEPAGKVVENRLDEEWRRRLRAAYRLPGVA
jgi:cell wall-associated NlpC family hydrolase